MRLWMGVLGGCGSLIAGAVTGDGVVLAVGAAVLVVAGSLLAITRSTG